MHTARLLTVFLSMYCTGGSAPRGCLVPGAGLGGLLWGVYLVPGAVPGPGGGVCSGGAWSGGVPGPGECLLRGGLLLGGWYPSMH